MTYQKTNTQFIKDMLLKVGFKDDDAMILLIDQTLAVFNDWVQTQILTALSDDQMDEFDKLVSKDASDAQIYDFFQKSISNFDSFMDGLYDKFEKMYISKYKKSLDK